MSNQGALNILPIPAFNDNYLWLFHRANDTRAYVVDPGDARPVQAALDAEGLSLAGILVTHHHADHIGGIDQLLSRSSVPVYGPAGGSVPQVSVHLTDNQQLQLDIGLTFRVITVPGHTLDHIAYFATPEGEAPLLFCGDTLFAGGCGRLFEGSAEEMHHSLGRLAQLPADTRVYCAHEYTLANLAFAEAVEPDNAELAKRIVRDRERRQQNTPTVPSTIALELSTNPFMRSGQSSVKRAAENHCQCALTHDYEVLAAIRRWKDNF